MNTSTVTVLGQVPSTGLHLSPTTTVTGYAIGIIGAQRAVSLSEKTQIL